MKQLIAILTLVLFSYLALKETPSRPNAEVQSETSEPNQALAKVKKAMTPTKARHPRLPTATPEIAQEFVDQDHQMQDEFPSTQEQELFAQGALDRFEQIRSIPGAAPVVDAIEDRLRVDPYAIRFENLEEENGMLVLGEDYLERLIPDPELRDLWSELMDLMIKDLGQDPKRSLESQYGQDQMS